MFVSVVGRRVVALTSLLVPAIAYADWSQTCPLAPEFSAAQLVTPAFSTDIPIPDGASEIRADEAEVVKDGVSVFSGYVEFIDPQTGLLTETLRYDRENAEVRFEDGGTLYMDEISWIGESGSYRMNEGVMELHDGEYLTVDGGRGRAEHYTKYQNENLSILKRVDFTTCGGPRPAWRIGARELKLDYPDDTGTAYHAVVESWGVPVFYFPYISFPLSDARKTGFLTPTLRESNDAGFDLHIPFYWNMAPNYDGLFNVRTITARGGAFGAELRYLQPDRSGQASLDFEVAPSDPLYDNKTRGIYHLKLNQAFDWQRARIAIDYNQVSDENYLEDFGTNLGITATRFLNRNADLSLAGNRWSANLITRNYQTVDETLAPASRPYRILPQLNVFTGSGGNNTLSTGLATQFSRFARENTLSGSRVHVAPQVFYPLRGAGYFVIPRLKLNATTYWLNDIGTLPDAQPTRVLPTTSVDAGLIAERRFTAFDTNLMQTLEPRVFYLYTPYKNQDDIPVFDSGLYDFTFQNLFLDNRFSGNDRIGDANQVTLALTSRLLNRDNGSEKLRVSFGQVVYFRDREVTLSPGGAVADNTLSESIGEVAAQIAEGWRARTTVQYDTNAQQLDKFVADLSYRPRRDNPGGEVFNVAYRQRRTTAELIEQTDLSFRLPLYWGWSSIGRFSYSLQDDRTLDLFGGLEYEHCCFGVRIGGRRFLRNAEGEYDNAIFAQIHLKGLAGFGTANESFLQGLIPGYRSPF